MAPLIAKCLSAVNCPEIKRRRPVSCTRGTQENLRILADEPLGLCGSRVLSGILPQRKTPRVGRYWRPIHPRAVILTAVSQVSAQILPRPERGIQLQDIKIRCERPPRRFLDRIHDRSLLETYSK